MSKSGIFTLMIFTLFSYLAIGQDVSSEVKEKFKVYGNCDMCKKKIDDAAETVDGVKSAKWSVSSHMITVKYDSTKTDLVSIKKAIANVGYDTKEYRAKDEVYNNLHHCCKYDRPAAIENE